jgi:hypothetical protein
MPSARTDEPHEEVIERVGNLSIHTYVQQVEGVIARGTTILRPHPIGFSGIILELSTKISDDMSLSFP